MSTNAERQNGSERREPVSYRVEKHSYSRGAWRVLNAATGEQIWRNEDFDHPFMGLIRLAGPVCFDRKRDALAWVEQESA